jgi:hypothetical protein
VLPMDSAGALFLWNHLKWLRKRRQLEEDRARVANHENPSGSATNDTSSSMAMVVGCELRRDDVLFGRGNHVVDHPGSIRFHQLVEIYASQFEEVPRMDKHLITRTIVAIVKESSGRFLMRGTGGIWRELDDDTVRQKVAHVFQNR